MCKNNYEARWRHGAQHCPNLVPNDYDRRRFSQAVSANQRSMPIRVIFSQNSTVHWDSLVHLWNDWYRQYLTADFPRLMVRFEDLLFQPDEVLQTIADCVGTELRDPLLFNTDSSKAHGSGTDLVHALIKYGSGDGRISNMTVEDLEYADRILDKDLVRIFDYASSEVSVMQFEEESHDAVELIEERKEEEVVVDGKNESNIEVTDEDEEEESNKLDVDGKGEDLTNEDNPDEGELSNETVDDKVIDIKEGGIEGKDKKRRT
jgi:hypothetical protein